jgi:pilus assembly protein CpaE
MGNLFEAISAAVLDDDPRRREWVRRELARLGCEVKASAGHGIVGVQTLYEAAPAIAFVSFEEPYARTTTTITHASIASRVVAYTSDPDVGAYQAALRAGAHVVLSSPPRPADLLKALERALPRKAPTAGMDAGQVVAVTSAKGGTGKSTIAANLAALLAREHASTVLLIDFAIDFGDSGLLLNLGDGISTARAARQIARSEIEEFRESLGYHASGLFVLAALQRFSERVTVDVHELEALLQLSIQSFDHVVVDTAAVFDDRLMLALESADLALLSVTPDVVSLVNTRRFLRDLENEGVAGEHFPAGSERSIAASLGGHGGSGAGAGALGALGGSVRQAGGAGQPAGSPVNREAPVAGDAQFAGVSQPDRQRPGEHRTAR